MSIQLKPILNLILSNSKDDEQEYEDTTNIITGINVILENDVIETVNIIWIEDKVEIVMASGKTLEITGKQTMAYKFGNTYF